MTQSQALKIMLKGQNVFLTGPPGSGKTHLLNKFIAQAKRRGLKVAVTATTGIAATYLGGTTIHSWAGIGIKSSLNGADRLKLKNNRKLVNRYKYTDVLVIDEVSMLDSNRLDVLNEVAVLLRRSPKPMGGLQLILVGDLFQLPPVNGGEEAYIFKAKSWDKLGLKVCYLTEQHRQQQGDELNPVLDAIRANRITDSELAVLKSKLKEETGLKRDILRLYSHNFDADELNNRNLDQLKGAVKAYKMQTEGPKSQVETLLKGLLSPEILSLKVGCQVIFTANNYREGYVNGDRGRVVDFKDGLPIIRMDRSAYLTVGRYKWQLEVDGQVVARAWQLPLKLAWAITIHKSQGMSLNEAQIDLSHAFSPGMGYVALSRLRSIDGLYLLGLNKMALYVDSNILKVDKTLRTSSDN